MAAGQGTVTRHAPGQASGRAALALMRDPRLPAFLPRANAWVRTQACDGDRGCRPSA